MVASCEVDVGFSVENHTHIGHRGKEDDGGLMLRVLETPQGGERFSRL